MRRKLLLLNAVLLLVAVTLGSMVREEWLNYRRANNAAGIRVEAGETTARSTPLFVPEAPPQAGNYNPIFERNLFSPNRTEFEPAEAAAETSTAPPMPGMPLLTGVTVIGERKLAFIQEPRVGAQPLNRTVQAGDTIMNFGKITEIRSDALVFTWGGSTHVVEMLSNDAGRARAAVAARLQTTVISIGAGRKGASAAVPAAAGTLPAGVAPIVGGGGGPAIQISSVGQGAGQAGATRSNPAVRGGATSVGAAQRQALPQGQQQNPGFIDTPFGRVMRPPPRTN